MNVTACENLVHRRGAENAENKPVISLPLSVGRYGLRFTDNGSPTFSANSAPACCRQVSAVAVCTLRCT